MSFDSIDLKPVASGQLSDSEGDLYTCPADTEAMVLLITLTNVSTGTVHDIKIKTRISSDDRVIWAGELGVGEGYRENDKIALAPSDTIRGVADAATAVDYTIHALEG